MKVHHAERDDYFYCVVFNLGKIGKLFSEPILAQSTRFHP